MKPKEYPLLCRCVEEGFDYGYRRARKYTEAPGEVELKDAIIAGILNEICEAFDFEDGKAEETEL